MDIEAGDLVFSIEVKSCSTVQEDQYSLRSDGPFGSLHVLSIHDGADWLKGKFFLGEAGQLIRDGGPITVIAKQQWLDIGLFALKIGTVKYTMIQNGDRFVQMREVSSPNPEILMVVTTDPRSAHA